MEAVVERIEVPQLRFEGFDRRWIAKLYGDIYSFYSTNSLSRDKLNYKEGKVKNIHYGDIHTKFSTIFDIINEKVPYINTDVDISKIKEENYCKEGDLVIADASEDYADIGKLIELQNLNNEKIVAGLHTFLARPKNNDLIIGFAAYLMQSWRIRKQIMTIAQGTKVLSLSTGRLGKLTLVIPTLPEQQKIASFLSAVDKKIEQLSQKKFLLETYKKGVMQKVFSQEIRFKQDDGSNYPDWEEKKLGEIFKINAGGDINKKYVSPIKTEKYQYPIYSNSEKNDGLFGYTINFKINEPAITVTGRGKLGIAVARFKKFYPIVRLLVLRPFQQFDLIFGENLINRINFFIESTGVPQLTAPQISPYKINIPSFQEQQKIGFFLSEIDKKIELVNTQLEQTKIFKKGLLQQMFV